MMEEGEEGDGEIFRRSGKTPRTPEKEGEEGVGTLVNIEIPNTDEVRKMELEIKENEDRIRSLKSALLRSPKAGSSGLTGSGVRPQDMKSQKVCVWIRGTLGSCRGKGSFSSLSGLPSIASAGLRKPQADLWSCDGGDPRSRQRREEGRDLEPDGHGGNGN